MKNTKLFGKKQITLIIIGIVAGVSMFLGVKYYESGSLTNVDMIASVLSLITATVTSLLVIRHGNKEESK